MAGYDWAFTVSPNTITEVTVTDGSTTVSLQVSGGGMLVPFFRTSAFTETTEVTISAVGYNRVTATVGDTNIEMTEVSTITCTRDSTQDVIGHASQIDANTLYNIADDTDVSLTILEALYPVGSVYITTASTCPLSALISGSTWELVSSGRVLQGADSGHSAGTTIEAGLPNITGTTADYWIWGGVSSGAFETIDTHTEQIITPGSGIAKFSGNSFDASRSSSIYGNSTTVQPPAYVVNIYRRVS